MSFSYGHPLIKYKEWRAAGVIQFRGKDDCMESLYQNIRSLPNIKVSLDFGLELIETLD